ncbi:MAG: GntR family transcriptional regulator [Pirellulales bacterium]|nr:GntR family transcriptional regulator [Pirellulales bacterium]
MTDPVDPATPIYQKLFNAYREDILSQRLQPGQRIDSINQMLKKHGVARETAKRVLNMLADEGYIVQRRGRGSFVSDLRPKAKIWGLVFPFYSIQYEDLILHVANRAAELGREVRHFCNYNSWEEEVRLVGIMVHERYEAVVVIPTMDESKTWDFYSHLSPQDSPVILLDHTMSSNNFRYVIQTYDLGVTRAIHHLIGQKGGSVAFVENELWSGRNMVLELMRGTYLDILGKIFPDFDPYILPHGSKVDAEELRKRRITGLFCCDDVSAIKVIGSLREQGVSVPDDFGVVSYGNSDLARYFTPAISSVDPRNAEMSRILAEVLHPSDDAKAQGKSTQLEHVVMPELIIRST